MNGARVPASIPGLQMRETGGTRQTEALCSQRILNHVLNIGENGEVNEVGVLVRMRLDGGTLVVV
jgi:hypothetical protein